MYSLPGALYCRWRIRLVVGCFRIGVVGIFYILNGIQSDGFAGNRQIF